MPAGSKSGPLRKADKGRAPSGLHGPARHPSRMRARTGGAVHTRFGLNHSRPPNVSIPGSKQAAGWAFAGRPVVGITLHQHRPLPSSPPRGAASTQVVETIRRPAAPRHIAERRSFQSMYGCNTLGGEEHRHRECEVKEQSDTVLGASAPRDKVTKERPRFPSRDRGCTASCPRARRLVRLFDGVARSRRRYGRNLSFSVG